MSVNPDEILIFKLRGMKSPQLKARTQATTQVPTPTPAPTPIQKPMPAQQAPQPAPKPRQLIPKLFSRAPKPSQPVPKLQQPIPQPQQPVPKIIYQPAPQPPPQPALQPQPQPQPVREFAPAIEAKAEVQKPQLQAKQGFRLFAPRPKVEKAAAKAAEAERIAQLRETKKQEESYESEAKTREVEALEMMASLYEPLGSEAPKPKKKARVKVGVFSVFSGFLFLLNTGVFGYFIYPQAVFLINHIETIGIVTFFLTLNYAYIISFANLVLVVLTLLSSILLITRLRGAYLLAGAVSAFTVLAVTYEYLDSNATYLLMVSLLTFICIISLIYSRMSAVRIEEGEEPLDFDVNWPRLETF